MPKILFVAFLFVTFPAFSQDIPFRERSTYTLELGMDYKKIPKEEGVQIKPGQFQPVMNEGYDFYISLKLFINELSPTDYKIRISDNHKGVRQYKKLKKPELFEIPIGRGVLIKNGELASEMLIEFIDESKNTQSIIRIQFKENGDFIVNDELYGKI